MSNACVQEIPSQLILSGASNQLIIGKPETSTYVQLSASAPAANRTYTIPDALASANVVLSTQSAVSQATSITTAVTSNSASTVITTQSASNAADATVSFTFNNSFITLNSIVLANVVSYAGVYGTAGIPYVTVNGISAGSCTIRITNLHPSNALSGVLTIGVLVC